MKFPIDGYGEPDHSFVHIDDHNRLRVENAALKTEINRWIDSAHDASVEYDALRTRIEKLESERDILVRALAKAIDCCDDMYKNGDMQAWDEARYWIPKIKETLAKVEDK